jgi:hypothetical protein
LIAAAAAGRFVIASFMVTPCVDPKLGTGIADTAAQAK